MRELKNNQVLAHEHKAYDASTDSQVELVGAKDLIVRDQLVKPNLSDNPIKNLTEIEKGARRSVSVNGEQFEVADDVVIGDVVGDDVKQVVSKDGEVIDRAEFRKKKLPDGIVTNVNSISKG